MAQKVVGLIKLQIPAGKATPAPPVGPALGQHGVNIVAFTKDFNERTKNDIGLIIPVVITVYSDRSFSFITKTPPAAVLLKTADVPGRDGLLEKLIHLIETACEGICAGGFHTPNHRWAICAFLKHAAKITGREEFSRRADEYLNEGLDINEDGEFAERSAGNYNQVNDDQMIRLYMATGDRHFLEAAEANLRMMLKYIDPDDSVFTNNSTRQDYGRKVYLNTYYMLFKLVGYFLGKKDLAAYG